MISSGASTTLSYAIKKFYSSDLLLFNQFLCEVVALFFKMMDSEKLAFAIVVPPHHFPEMIPITIS
jgi:hypothetical protein